MRTKHTDHVKFFLAPNKGERAPLRAVFRFSGERVDIGTGIAVEPKKWHTGKMRMKPNTQQDGQSFQEINERLDHIAANIVNAYNSFERPPAKSEFLRAYHALKEPQAAAAIAGPMEVFSLWDAFIEDGRAGKLKKKTPWSALTVKRYNNFKNHWQAYAPGMLASELSPALIDGFKTYMEAIHVNTTNEKNLKLAKVYFTWLAQRGEAPGTVAGYLPAVTRLSDHEQRKQNLIALTRQQVDRLYKLAIPESKQYLQRTRDVFVFQTQTGQRYSDLRALKRYNFISKAASAPNGAIEFTTVKNNDRLMVPLTAMARTIVDRYKDIPGEQLLPVVSNQKYNGYLKELGKLAGFDDVLEFVSFQGKNRIHTTARQWEKLTTHVARKTFVNVAFGLGLSPEVVAAITGDGLDVIMRHYRAIRETEIVSEMGKFDKANIPTAKRRANMRRKIRVYMMKLLAKRTRKARR